MHRNEVESISTARLKGMVNPQMLEWIKQRLTQNVSRDELKSVLLTNGWQEADINEAFTTLETTTPVQVASPSVPIAQPLTEQIPPKKHKILKVFLWILALPIIYYVLKFTIYTTASLITSDILPIDESAFVLEKVQVKDEDNVLTVLEKIPTVLTTKEATTTVDIINGTIKDKETMEEALIGKQEALTLFEEASSKLQYQNPAFVDQNSITADLEQPDSTKILRSITRLNSVQAILLAQNGNQKEALEKAFIPLKIANKIENSQTGMLDILIAGYIKGTSLLTIARIIEQENIASTSQVSSDDLIKYSTELNNYYTSKEGYKMAAKNEYFFARNSVKGIYNGLRGSYLDDSSKYKAFLQKIPDRIQPGYIFRINETLQIVSGQYQKYLDSINLPCSELKYIPPKETQTSKSDMYLTSIKENGVGVLLTSTIAPVYNFTTKRCYSDLHVAITQTLLALKAYKIDNGKLPSSLEELVPKYLSTIPQDPFTYPATSLMYSQNNKTISSVRNDTWEAYSGLIKDGEYKIKF